MTLNQNAARSWADGPWPLIETPSKTQDISNHESLYIANEMAFAHNAMLRGLNALYLQAEQVSESQDIGDFLFFLRSWAGWVSHHHVLEETQMFPQFEKVIGQPNFLEGNIQEHHTFQPILKELLVYGTETKPENYQASTVCDLIERMAPSFRDHLANEITSLISMAPYDGPGLLKIYQECEAEAGKQDKVRLSYIHWKRTIISYWESYTEPIQNIVPPMVLGLRDITFEGGNQWPAMPPLSAYFVHYLFARKHSGAWRFLPSDTWGNPRPLAFAKL